MTKQPSEAAKVRAVELANAANAPGSQYQFHTGHFRDPMSHSQPLIALATLIDEVSEAAKNCRGLFAFAANEDILAPFILPEPVDPLLIEARKMREEECGGCVSADFLKYLHDGSYDDSGDVQKYVRAIRRGMELAQEQSQ